MNGESNELFLTFWLKFFFSFSSVCGDGCQQSCKEWLQKDKWNMNLAKVDCKTIIFTSSKIDNNMKPKT